MSALEEAIAAHKRTLDAVGGRPVEQQIVVTVALVQALALIAVAEELRELQNTIWRSR